MKTQTPFPLALYELGLLGMIFLAAGSGYLVEFVRGLEPDQTFNFFEGVLWVGIGVAFLWRAFRKTKFRRLQMGAAVSFLLFGASDFIEIRTGAWYTPWTLLFLKAACVISFLLLLRAYRFLSKQQATLGQIDPQTKCGGS